MHGAGFVSRRETAHWSSGLAHKGWMCSSETPRGETGAEPCRSRLVVDKGTRDSRAATARSPAPRRRMVPREQSLPRFLDHQAGRMWTLVLFAGSARPSRSLARPAVWRRPASSPRGRALVLVGFSLAAESRPRSRRRRWKWLREASARVHRSLTREYTRQSNPAHRTVRRGW